MRFGVSVGHSPAFLTARDAGRLADLVRMLDDYGVAAIGAHDTAFMSSDAFMRVTLMATASSRARVGLQPTNPLTREPQVMAAFAASIDVLSGGRAFVNIASGDSSVLNIGYRPASLARIEDYLTCVRELLDEGRSTYQGRPQSVRWDPVSGVTLALCAEGPKTLRLAGRIADGVVVGSGLLPEVIEDARRQVAAGAAEAGRDAADVKMWFVARSMLDDDRDRAIDGVKWSVASILNHAMRFGLDGKQVPEELRPRIAEYVRGYALHDHALAEGRNPRRMHELGLTEYAMRRWSLAGDAGDWIERIGRLADAGVERLWVALDHGDLDRQHHYVKVFGEQILPYIR